jgi:hypothetical protein
VRHARIRNLIIAAAVALGFATSVPPAVAIEEFFAELQAKYLKRDSQKESDIALVVAFEQARCTICHPGDDTHTLTTYGSHLSMRVNKSDKGKKQRIQAALTEIGVLRSNPHDPQSPTYDELFRQGRLPPATR